MNCSWWHLRKSTEQYYNKIYVTAIKSINHKVRHKWIIKISLSKPLILQQSKDSFYINLGMTIV